MITCGSNDEWNYTSPWKIIHIQQHSQLIQCLITLNRHCCIRVMVKTHLYLINSWTKYNDHEKTLKTVQVNNIIHALQVLVCYPLSSYMSSNQEGLVVHLVRNVLKSNCNRNLLMAFISTMCQITIIRKKVAMILVSLKVNKYVQ